MDNVYCDRCGTEFNRLKLAECPACDDPRQHMGLREAQSVVKIHDPTMHHPMENCGVCNLAEDRLLQAIVDGENYS